MPDVKFVWVVKKKQIDPFSLPIYRELEGRFMNPGWMPIWTGGLKAPLILISPTKGLGQLWY